MGKRLKFAATWAWLWWRLGKELEREADEERARYAQWWRVEWMLGWRQVGNVAWAHRSNPAMYEQFREALQDEDIYWTNTPNFKWMYR